MDEPDKLQCAIVLERAADLIEHYGWQKHDLGARARGYCAAGALMLACGAQEDGCGVLPLSPRWGQQGALLNATVAMLISGHPSLRNCYGNNALSSICYWNNEAMCSAEITSGMRNAASAARQAYLREHTHMAPDLLPA